MRVELPTGAVTIDADRVDGDVDRFVRRYLEGEQVAFDGAVDLAELTTFQQAVIGALRDVPYGEIITYGALARRIGRSAAVRAVANACGTNPCPIIIPCHRVVAKHGLGGYSDGGVRVKEWLLRHEEAGIG